MPKIERKGGVCWVEVVHTKERESRSYGVEEAAEDEAKNQLKAGGRYGGGGAPGQDRDKQGPFPSASSQNPPKATPTRHMSSSVETLLPAKKRRGQDERGNEKESDEYLKY